LLEVGGNPRPPAPLGLGAPEEAIKVSMPAYERVGTDNRQQLAPRDDARQQREGDARGVVGPSGPSLPFDVASELLAQKEVLGVQPTPRPERRSGQPQEVNEQSERRSKHVRR
jgi:hypothetical protein